MIVQCETCGISYTPTAQRLRRNKRNWCCRQCWLDRSRLSKENWTLYVYWYALKSRCHNPEDPRFKHHGAKGFSLSLEWKKFDNFCVWALENNWVKGYSLMLYGNSTKYSKDTCYWVPKAVKMKTVLKEKKYKLRIGERFGSLTIVGEKYIYIENKGHEVLYKYCLCDCGTYELCLPQNLIIAKKNHCRSCRAGAKNKWAKNFDCCLECGTFKIEHKCYGYCTECYKKTRTLKYWRKELLVLFDLKLNVDTRMTI